uniref:glutaredoxin n=1 Tax=Bangia atropurpurea TaxID=31347 RepID=UPI0007C5EB2E|nr:glutaredoxin [Bangia atropurpurea]UNJ18197.1 glutaredoxin [Bangia atropurpurea]
MDIETRRIIDTILSDNKIVLFMKGSKIMPMCGFSNTAIQILNTLNIDYFTYDILENENIRQAIKEYSSWPTIPQLYINKEFIGGTDIMLELFEQGELQAQVETVLAT